MATTKKTTKKASPRTASKSAAVKKAPAKKSVVKRSSAKKTSAKKSQMRSFHISPEESNFTDVKVTRQTIYWIILIGFIIFAQLWILKLQIEVASIIDAQQAQLQQY